MSSPSLLALDVGAKRIGVALTSLEAKLPSPLTTLINDDSFVPKLQDLIREHHVALLVVGLPRGMEGQETEQTRTIRVFADALSKAVSVPVHMQDEAVTSVQAKQILDEQGKPYDKEDIDAMAASLILQDFINTRPQELEHVQAPAA